MGTGNKSNATRPLEPHEVDKLYDYDFFGSSSLVLQRTVWWKLTTNFEYHARDKSRKLQFGDIKVNTDHNGCKYLEWDKERGTKTRTGESSYSHQHSCNPKAYATGGSRCPVKIFENFVNHRPETSKKNDSPFFLTVIPPNHKKTSGISIDHLEKIHLESSWQKPKKYSVIQEQVALKLQTIQLGKCPFLLF